MGIFIPRRRVKHRRFDYEPRYYNPEKDESIKRRMRIKSRARHKRRSKLDMLYLLILLLFAMFIYNQLA